MSDLSHFPADLRPVIVISQARLGSTRLPRKILLEVAGQNLLSWHLGRLKKARIPDRILLATTEEPGIEQVIDAAAGLGIASFQGSTHDVLARYAGAAASVGARTIVRVTSDCPLIDPGVIDDLLTAYGAAYLMGCRYYSLDITQFPRGLDAEVMDGAALRTAADMACDPADREHVTPYLRRNADRFHPRFLTPDYPTHGERWCVDEAADLALIERILGKIALINQDFTWHDVVTLLDRHPDWRALNAHVGQKQG